jgi:hypothetical protein
LNNQIVISDYEEIQIILNYSAVEDPVFQQPEEWTAAMNQQTAEIIRKDKNDG